MLNLKNYTKSFLLRTAVPTAPNPVQNTAPPAKQSIALIIAALSEGSVPQIDIYYRFNIAVFTAIADRRGYDKKRKAA